MYCRKEMVKIFKYYLNSSILFVYFVTIFYPREGLCSTNSSIISFIFRCSSSYSLTIEKSESLCKLMIHILKKMNCTGEQINTAMISNNWYIHFVEGVALNFKKVFSVE